MKNKILVCGALLGTILLGSCAKLEEKPYGLINSTTFFKTPQDAEAGIIYAYTILPEVGYYGRGWILVTELPTENLTQKGDAGVSNFELDELRTTSTNADLDNIWTYMYRGIARANAVITNVPGISGMTDGARNQIIGEGRFLRALHYFNLVRLFGQVPLRDDVIETAGQIPVEKASIQAVYDLILNDLKQAEQLITANKISEGRAGKAAVQSLLAKVYLHLASSKASGAPQYGFVTNADEMYAQAKEYAGKVVNGQNDYTFTNLLPDIYNTEIYKKAATSEHIMDAAVDRTGEREGSFSKLPNMFLLADRPMTIPYDAANPGSPQINIGQGWSHFRTEAAIYNAFATGDKRKSQLIVSSYTNGGTTYNLDINSSSRPFSRKYIDPLRIGDASSANTPILRYSDILLTYAEASGPTAEGYAALQKVRDRAGLGAVNPNLGVQAFRDAVVEERAFELAFEGNRLFDLRRTNSVEKILRDKYGKTVTSGAYFFPIPQREIDNNPLMKP